MGKNDKKGNVIKKETVLVIFFVLLASVVIFISFTGIPSKDNKVEYTDNDVVEEFNTSEKVDSDQILESENFSSEIKTFAIEEAKKAVKDEIGDTEIFFPETEDFFKVIKTGSDREGYDRYTIVSYFSSESEFVEFANTNYIVVLDIKSVEDEVYCIGVFFQ